MHTFFFLMHTTFKKHCPSLTQINVRSLSFFRPRIPVQGQHGVLYSRFQAKGGGLPWENMLYTDDSCEESVQEPPISVLAS